MITTGLVKGKYIDGDGNTIYQVDISIFKNAGVTSEFNDTLFNCTASASPGTYDLYKEDDKVFVGFVNNQLQHPVILGKIYQCLPSEKDIGSTFRYIDRLEVTGVTKLSEDSSIGDITYDDLCNMRTTIENIGDYTDLLIETQKPKQLWQNTYSSTNISEINVDLSKYTCIIIDFFNTNSTDIFTQMYKIGYNAEVNQLVRDNGVQLISKHILVGTTKITIDSTATITNIATGTSTTSSAYLNPMVVYGL